MELACKAFEEEVIISFWKITRKLLKMAQNILKWKEDNLKVKRKKKKKNEGEKEFAKNCVPKNPMLGEEGVQGCTTDSFALARHDLKVTGDQ